MSSKKAATSATRSNPIVKAIARGAKRTIAVPPDPEDMNDQRSDAAEDVIHVFAKGGLGEFISYEDDEGNDTGVMLAEMITQNLTDLIANFGHYCDRNDIEFSEILRRAQFHYDEETNNKGKQRFS